MTAKKLMSMLTAAATAMPSIALAHNPFQWIEKDLSCCAVAALSVCLFFAWLRGTAKTSSAKVTLLALFIFTFIISIFFTGISVAFFYRDFNEPLLLLLVSMIIAQVFIICRTVAWIARKACHKKDDADMSNQRPAA